MSARVLSALCCCCLVLWRGSAAPATADNIIEASTLLHTANHEVARLGVIFKENGRLDDKTVFFIETDREENVNYGLYAFKNNVTTKLLDNARDIVVANLANAYFAAKDGIYLYNNERNTAVKYGSVSDEVISLAVENSTGALYYLNKQRQLYKVTEDGRKSTIVEAVKNAEEIVADYTGHLYYYTADKKFYVYDGHDVRIVEGIPDGLKKVWFIKTPMLITEDYGIVNGDDEYYGISPNASVRAFGRAPFAISTLSADSGIVVYFAKDKKIYELNIIEMVVEGLVKGIFQGLRNFVQDLHNALNPAGAR